MVTASLRSVYLIRLLLCRSLTNQLHRTGYTSLRYEMFNSKPVLFQRNVLSELTLKYQRMIHSRNHQILHSNRNCCSLGRSLVVFKNVFYSINSHPNPICIIAITFLSFFPGGSTISRLDVSFCDKIGDQALNHISQGLFHLKSLSLNHCQITDEGLARIAKSLHDLEVLYIGQCNRITDKGLQSLSEYLVNLNSIDLYGCTQISTIGIETIMKLPELSRMNLELWLVR